LRTTVSNLSIGLVTSPNEESKQLISLLEALGVQVTYHITPQEISSSHIEDKSLNVWLLNIDDDHWHDNIDQLLDESDASIYFNEPGTLIKQSHPDFWCQKLVSRLHELTGLDEEPEPKNPLPASTEQPSTLAAQGNLSSASTSQSEIEQIDSRQPDPILTESHHSVSEVYEGLESVDELSSALDQLETSSIGLPSDIAAELVSELESISPELENAVDDSLFLESELLLEPGLSHEQDSEIERKLLNEQDFSLEDKPNSMLVSDENTTSGENSLDDFSEEILEVSEPNFSLGQLEIEEPSETAEIADEIMALAAQPEESINDLESIAVTFDEIDFSSSSIPVLESAREDDQKILESNYGPKVDEERSINEDSLDIEEDIKQDDLSLTSIEEEKITGKAIFLEEEQSKQAVPVEQPSDDGLSLESIAQTTISGRATFIEEEPQEPLKSATEEEEPLDDGGLSLETNSKSPINGKAEFVIDDQPKESDLEKSPLIAEKKPVVKQQPEDDFSGLNLQPIDDQNQTSWLSDHPSGSDMPEPAMPESEILGSEIPRSEIAEPELKQSEQEAIEHFAETDENLTSFNNESDFDIDLKQPSSATKLDDLGETLELQEFEIPMLEESATGLDFEEVVQQPLANELTPCWVIGASLGGPAAVKRFLQSLPADINASFIVAQHIDENFLPVLAEILTSNSHFEVQVAKGSNSISAGKIYLAPLKGKLIFLKDGSMLVDHSQKWSEPYLPCIDDVIESLAVIYGKKSGAIIFSGMGQDGLNGVKKMLSLNGQVWAQSVDTCANSSMPEAVINAGLASVVAAPEMLADRLVSYLNQ